jgi:putative lipoic acid-binding regulatory protein
MKTKNAFSPLYPCEFPMKIIGIPGAEFESGVLLILRTHAGEIRETDFDRRTSSGGKYLSLTIRIVAQSREHLERLYAELNAHEKVIMVL